jgi:hypothetical protein
LLEEWSEGFKRDDLRYQGIRKDLKVLESTVKDSKRFLSNYKKSSLLQKVMNPTPPIRLSF